MCEQLTGPDFETSQKLPEGFSSLHFLLEHMGIRGENNFEEVLETSFLTSIKSWVNTEFPYFSVKDIEAITTPEMYNQECLTGFKYQGEWHYFDLYTQTKVPGQTLEEVNAYRESHLPEEIETIRTGTYALQSLMEKNSHEFLDFLDDSDSAGDRYGKFGEMTPKELQMTIRSSIHQLTVKNGLTHLCPSLRAKVARYIQVYMEIIMGIGESYEEGADYFYKTEQELDIYIRSSVVHQGCLHSCHSYYASVMSRISQNSGINEKNRESHEIFTQKLGKEIFALYVQDQVQNLQSPPSEDDSKFLTDTMEFVSLLRGETGEVPRTLRNGDLAQEICIEIIQRPGGITQGLESNPSLHFTDPEVGNNSPAKVGTDAIHALQKIGIKEASSLLQNTLNIDIKILTGATEQDGVTSYNAASFKQKQDLSLLIRLTQKIQRGELNKDHFQDLTSQEISQAIYAIAEEIRLEAIKVTLSAYDALLKQSGSLSRHLDSLGDNILPQEREAIEALEDIRGIGWFNLKDNTLNTSKEALLTIGAIVGTIAVVMIATGGSAAILGGGALIGEALIASSTVNTLTSVGIGASTGTIANIAFFDKRRYNNYTEMSADIGSDLVVNTAHAVYMERLTMQLWKGLSKSGRGGLIGTDLISGILVEGVREDVMRSWFNGPDLLGSPAPDISQLLNSGGWTESHHDHYAEKAGLESTDPEIQARLSELNPTFQEAYTLHKAWNHDSFRFENNPMFAEWFSGEMNSFHRQISKESTLDFLDLVEQWIIQQLDLYDPE